LEKILIEWRVRRGEKRSRASTMSTRRGGDRSEERIGEEG